jgi:hypothetical protein
MQNSNKGILFWTPRILGILFILFVSLFALDIFDMQLGFWDTIVGLFMHLLPSIAMTIALVLGWRREWIGALGFFAFAIWYIAIALDNRLHWGVYAILVGIPVLIGLLFLAGWWARKQIRPA